MTETQIRVVPAADAERYLATDHTVWFQEVPSAAAEEQLIGLDENQRFAAEVDGADPGTYAGIYGVFPLTLAVPGPDVSTRPVACAGLTWVGVHPDHRRQGVLSAMIRDHLERVRQQEGVHLSALHASEPAIYGRYGYGLASLQLQVSLGRGTKLTAPHLEGPVTEITTQLASASDPDVAKRMRECHLACADLGSVVGDWGTTPGSATSCRSTCGTRSPSACCSRGATARTSASSCSAEHTSGSGRARPVSWRCRSWSVNRPLGSPSFGGWWTST